MSNPDIYMGRTNETNASIIAIFQRRATSDGVWDGK
jgi:hypothetical protein